MTAALEGGEWSAARPGCTLPLGKTWYPFYRRLCGPQDPSGRAENLVPRYGDLAPRISKMFTDKISKIQNCLIWVLIWITTNSHQWWLSGRLCCVLCFSIRHRRCYRVYRQADCRRAKRSASLSDIQQAVSLNVQLQVAGVHINTSVQDFTFSRWRLWRLLFPV